MCLKCITITQNRLHQQNVNQSRSHTHTSQTPLSTSLVLLNTSRCFQAPLELSKVLSDSARALLDATQSPHSYGDAFRMLQDLTYWIVKFGNSCDLSAGQQETSRAAEISAQLYRRLGAIFSQQLFLGFHNHNAFHLLYLSL